MLRDYCQSAVEAGYCPRQAYHPCAMPPQSRPGRAPPIHTIGDAAIPLEIHPGALFRCFIIVSCSRMGRRVVLATKGKIARCGMLCGNPKPRWTAP